MVQADLELNEQSPLNNETQNITNSVVGIETSTAGAETTAAEKLIQEKKRWFFNKKVIY